MSVGSRAPVRKQRAIYYRSRNSEIALENCFYKRMFVQDVSLGVMPVGGRTKRKGFSVELANADERGEEILIQGLGGHDHFGRGSLEEALSEFFQKTAASLCWDGLATYEIAYLFDARSDAPVGFELFYLPGEQLQYSGDEVIQIVPPELAKENQVPERNVLPIDSVITFFPPPEFREALNDVMSSLPKFDRFPASSLVRSASAENVPYDFSEHQRQMKQALVCTIRPIGWNARSMFNDVTLSYYWITLHVRFHSFLIALRESMLKTLNRSLLEVGTKLSISAQLQINGLPTQRDCEDALEKLRAGEAPFTEIMSAFDQGW